MRKLLLAIVFAASFAGVFAQKLDDVKEKIQKGKFDEAKEKIDKVMADPKNQESSDAWFYKAQTYQGLSKIHPDDPSLAAAALDAMGRYLKLEEKQGEAKRNLLSTLDNNKTVFDIYTSYFQAGASNYNNKNYEKALENFEKAIESFELLKKYNFTTVPFDTTSNLYAGVAAETLKQKDVAIKYYSRLADQKIADTAYRGVYEYIVNHYVMAKDDANARKYLTIGETVFPNYSPWLSYELELVGDDKNQKLAKYEELMQKYPTNYDLAIDYVVQYFNYTYANETKPADYAARQDKLTQALQKTMALQQTPLANYLMGRHINNQIADLEDEQRAIKGTAAADLAKKKDLAAKISQKYDELLVYSQKAYDLYSADGIANLKGSDKVYFKEVTRDLVDYYQRKKQADKVTFYQNILKELN
jgi:tetratricopeptide (TPR) repeat protein